MENEIQPTKQALTEALSLSLEIIEDIERSIIALVDIALKTSRLARLLNDFDYEEAMRLEASGYPVDSDNIMSNGHWQLAGLANRIYETKDETTGESKRYNQLYQAR